jgi:hypothetical protein
MPISAAPQQWQLMTIISFATDSVSNNGRSASSAQGLATRYWTKFLPALKLVEPAAG